MLRKKKPLQKLVMLALGSALVLSACSDNTDKSQDTQPSASASASASATSTPKLEPITFSMNSSNPSMNLENDVAKEITKRTGGTIKWDVLTGDTKQLMNVWLTAGDYPDVVNVPDDVFIKYTEANALVELTDLITKHGPNIMKAYNNDLSPLKRPDGKIWALRAAPTKEIENLNDVGWISIQAAVLKEAGFPQIKTLDDLYKVVLDYAKKHPEIGGGKTIGFSNFGSENHLFNMLDTAARMYSGMPATGLMNVDDSYNARIRFFEPGYTDILKFFNKANREGLFDPEMLVQTPEQLKAKCVQGRVLVVFGASYSQGCSADLQKAGMGDRSYVQIDLVAPGKPKIVPAPSKFVLNGTDQWVGITKNAKDPVRLVQFFDEMYKLENQILIGWGIEGVHYKVENGKRVVTDYLYNELSKGGDAWERLGVSYNRPLLAMMQGGAKLSDGDFARYNSSLSWIEKSLKPEIKEVLAAYKAKSLSDLTVKPTVKDIPFNTSFYTEEMNKFAPLAIKEWGTAVSKYVLEKDEAKLDGIWADLEKKLKDIGLEKYNKDVSDKYKEYVKTLK